MTGDEAHAEKAAEILNAWSSTLRSIKNHDAALLVGMSGYHYCVAGELIKHTWDKWPQDEQARFAAMQRDIFYPIIKDFYATANGNWDASMMQVMIAMGVFLDDQKMFDQATEYFLQGRGNGAIGNYFMASGQCQESGRDQAHTQMGLDFLANTCETAWIQGVDLYGALDNRLLRDLNIQPSTILDSTYRMKRTKASKGVTSTNGYQRTAAAGFVQCTNRFTTTTTTEKGLKQSTPALRQISCAPKKTDAADDEEGRAARASQALSWRPYCMPASRKLKQRPKLKSPQPLKQVPTSNEFLNLWEAKCSGIRQNSFLKASKSSDVERVLASGLKPVPRLKAVRAS